MTLGMHGAAIPLPHVPSWHAQGQLYQYRNTVCLVRSSGMRKTGDAYTGEMRNAYTILLKVQRDANYAV